MQVVQNPHVALNNAREEARQDLFRSISHPVSRFCPICGREIEFQKAKWICNSRKCKGRVIENCCGD
jgi:hypothetical protein